MIGEESHPPDYPETFEQALAWAKMRAAESGKMPQIVSNPSKEMTYCALTGNVLKKSVTKPAR
jgi:hypothetical protein